MAELVELRGETIGKTQKEVLETICMFPYLSSFEVQEIVGCSRSAISTAYKLYLDLYIPEKERGETKTEFLAREGQCPLFRYNPHQIAFESVYMEQAKTVKRQ